MACWPCLFVHFLSAVQDKADFLGCKYMLLAHDLVFVHSEYSQILILGDNHNPLIPQSVWIFRIDPTQMQHLAIGLLTFHEVHMNSLLEPVQIPLDDTSPVF